MKANQIFTRPGGVRRGSGLFVFLCFGALAVSATDWPAWRGPLGTGVCGETNLPTRWSATENVKWRVGLPERGNSTPIVSRGRVFVTQAVGNRRTLMCFERANGKLLWQTGIAAREADPTHATNPYCSASPVTDGERVIVSFASEGLYCYDFSGKELWKRTDLGKQVHIWGNGSSPALHSNLCLLNFGPGATTYLLAVNKQTGKTVWQHHEPSHYGQPPASSGQKGQPKANPAYVGSWTTPVIMPVEGKEQVLMIWPGRLAAYEPANGKELWSCGGLNPLCYTSVIYGEGLAVALGGFSGMALAVRAGGSGDVTSTRRVWHHERSPQRIGSGVVHEGHIYIHNDPGTAMCFDLKTGDNVWTQPLKGAGKSQNWSSTMLADGNCYTITQGGDCFVFKASPKFELISVNSLGEPSNSSIVPSNGELFIRTHQALWCIGARP